MKLNTIFFWISMSAVWLLYAKPAAAQGAKVEQILIKADRNTLLRSFVDIKNGKRVTHAISVGSPLQVHYTYDADNGKLILLWKGAFLDATPMWHDRGDGSSRPLGSVIQLGTAIPEIQRLASPESEFRKDTTGSGFRPKGYTLNKDGIPVFKYQTYGIGVKDAITVLPGGKGIHREINLEGSADQLYLCIAKDDVIEDKGGGNYVTSNLAYSIMLEGEKPIIRTTGGTKELLLPVKAKTSYSILFNQ